LEWKRWRCSMPSKLMVTARILPDGLPFTISGRDAWALLELVDAGPHGCTPIDNPGPRWSGYVHNLRRQYGLAIETRYETHKGPFPGTHARYMLASAVKIIHRSNDPERIAA
jgi:hypothetical protein